MILKNQLEAVLAETIIIGDLKETTKILILKAFKKKVRSSLLNFPSSDYIYIETYGHVF
jgi:aldehyde dehydrogenase (NAD+)